jgi:transposase-like protein
MELGTSPEVEVISPARQGRRRRYTAEEKRRIVEETKVPGQSVSAVSRRYGVSPSQLFKWRRLVEEGTMSSLSRSYTSCRAIPVVILCGHDPQAH